MSEILKERSELDPQFQWDLTPMFESDAAWETALDSLDADIESLADRKSTRLNSSHSAKSRMPSSA